jgi:hypothetical protein
MALGTEEAAFNALVDAFMDDWETLIDTGLADGEETRIVWVASKRGDNPSDSQQGSDTTAVFDMGRQFYWHNNPDTAADVPLEIGGRPLFFKITNAAGDLS